jgi:competence protein CoiA
VLYANVNGVKSLPTKGLRGVCPACGETVTAKCGAIVTHHWSHPPDSQCDPWAEKIGHWHLGWQNLIEAVSVEVVVGPHRADIMGNDDVVVEL